MYHPRIKYMDEKGVIDFGQPQFGRSVVLAALNRSTLQLNRLKYNKLRTSYQRANATADGNHIYYVYESGGIWDGTGSSKDGFADKSYSVVLSAKQLRLRTSYNTPSPHKFIRCIESGAIEISSGSDNLGRGSYPHSVVLEQ